MCDTCGCNITTGNRHLIEAGGPLAHTRDGRASIEVLTSLLSANDREAAHNRAHFDQHQVLAVNLMSSPGSGKTSLLEATIEAIGARCRLAVIEGDLATENDADRIRAKGVPAVQITTGQACHLDAHMVHGALHQLDLGTIDVLFIENVGNLVCPASFDLGQHRNVVLLSATEGDDKPAKYPVMFRAADLVMISKSDLVPLLGDFDVEKATGHVRALANAAPVIATTTRTKSGISAWIAWLDEQLAARRLGLAHRAQVKGAASLVRRATAAQS